jgi:hypothetical protein
VNGRRSGGRGAEAPARAGWRRRGGARPCYDGAVMRLRALAAIALLLAGGAARTDPGLPFIEDDWPRALAEARARDLPLFVEAWAPW